MLVFDGYFWSVLLYFSMVFYGFLVMVDTFGLAF